MPLRDDWASAAELIRRLDRTVASYPCTLDVLLVDDASLQVCNGADFQSQLAAVCPIRTLRLRRNLGHQRAIAIGLVHVQQNMTCDAVLVMDADGEHTADFSRAQSSALSLTSTIPNAVCDSSRSGAAGRSLWFFGSFSSDLQDRASPLNRGHRRRVGNFHHSAVRSTSPRSLSCPRCGITTRRWCSRGGLPFTTIPICVWHTRIAGRLQDEFCHTGRARHRKCDFSIWRRGLGVRLLIASMAGSHPAGPLGIVAVFIVRFFTDMAILGLGYLRFGRVGHHPCAVHHHGDLFHFHHAFRTGPT